MRCSLCNNSLVEKINEYALDETFEEQPISCKCGLKVKIGNEDFKKFSKRRKCDICGAREFAVLFDMSGMITCPGCTLRLM